MHPRTTHARPPLYRLHDTHGAAWHPRGDAILATDLVTSADPANLALFDLTSLPRIGFKGRGTMEAMKKRGIALEAKPNVVFPQADGTHCLVLAASEVLLLSSLSGDGARFAEWERTFRLEDEERTYPLPRRDSHAWFAISGRHAPSMFAKLCGIDLRPHTFANHTIAQTSVARLNAILARADIGQTVVFHLLADIASSLYLSKCLLDAAGEFGGEFAGLERIERL